MQAQIDSQRPATAATPSPSTRPRVDLYAGIHKALRSFMADTLVRIGRLDVDDRADLEAGLAQLGELLEVCTGHVEHENRFVHAAIEARAPQRSAQIAAEHEEHLGSIAALREEAAALASAPATSAPLLALRLYRHLALFVAENLQHMHVEETQHNAALWEHYSDSELLALHDRLTASLAPGEAWWAARWMVPASTPAERALIMGGMKAAMPPEALLSIAAMLRPHLDAAGWNKLAACSGIDSAFA